MVLTLYGMAHSHPVLAARLMLRRKGARANVRDVLPGLHPIVVRAAGFPGRTVPAMRIGDDKVQGTLAISRALDAALPDRPLLFPTDPGRRRAVEEAERWAHDEIQPVAARAFRWAGARDNGVRAWMASEVIGWPAPRVCGVTFAPVMAYYARIIDATTERVRADITGLDAKLDHVDALMADGVLGGELTAADCQAFASLRLLAAHEDLRPLLEAHACGRHALDLVPDFPVPAPGGRAARPVPASLPREWIPGGGHAASVGSAA